MNPFNNFGFQPYFNLEMLGMKIIEDVNCVEKINKIIRRKWRKWEWFKQYVLFIACRYDYTPIGIEVEYRPAMYRLGKFPDITIVCHPSLAQQIKVEMMKRNR